MDRRRNPRIPPKTRPKPLAWVFLVIFAIIASLTAYLAFSMVRSAIASLGKNPDPPNIQEPFQEPAQDLQRFLDVSTPLQSGDNPPAQAWDGHSPITILLLGVDDRDWEPDNGPPLTDTIILATINPQERSAAMLSIPRDLWVEVPGEGYHKINQAYRLGLANGHPTGGNGLAIDTVESLFGIDIPYYALIDFNAFVRLIDEIQGVKIDVPEAIRVAPLDDRTILLKPGIQTLPGNVALAYVRNRDTIGSDFDRVQRQQQVIVAIQKRLIRFDMIPTLIQKAPILYEEIAAGVMTNLTLQQAAQLAWLTTQIPPENVRRFSIQPDQVINAMSYDGMAILQPIPDELLALRDSFFSNETPTSPQVVQEMDPGERTIEENAVVTLRNGTYTTGLASETGEYLRGLNIQIVDIANAEKIYAQTTIIDYAGKPYTLAYLAEILNVPPGRIYQRYDPSSETDIMVILGEDWATNNNMP
jgi:LCP family protein required for cell wall assembly